MNKRRFGGAGLLAAGASVSNERRNHVKGQQNYTFFEDFDDFKKLGSGGYGLVVRAIKKDEGRECALKLIPFKNNPTEDRKTLEEAQRLYTLPEHPSVIRCDAYFIDRFDQIEHSIFRKIVKPKKDDIMSIFPTNTSAIKFLCIQMELFGGGGTLKTWLKNRTHLDKQLATNLFLQITSGIDHIHSNGLIHRDLKPANILFDGGKTKISDLGYAANHTGGEYTHTTNAGANLYQSPEQGIGKYGNKADYYALGLILYELFYVEAAKNVGEALTRLKFYAAAGIHELADLPDVASLVQRLLSIEASNRPSAQEIETQVQAWKFWKKPAIRSVVEDMIQLDLNESPNELLSCATCSGRLNGLRFQCTVCVDYFLCDDCERRDVHPVVHDLLKIKTPRHSKLAEIFGENEEGCAHYDYERRCKVQCPDKACGRFFPCRLCHDSMIKGHKFDRKQVVTVQCNSCDQLQLPARSCQRCSIEFAEYFCEICKLYDNQENASELIFHCDKCGFCRKRIHEGVIYDHCVKCKMCYPTLLLIEDLERAFPVHQVLLLASNAGTSLCSICDKTIHDSLEPATLVSCGHYVHITCKGTFPTDEERCPTCGNW